MVLENEYVWLEKRTIIFCYKNTHTVVKISKKNYIAKKEHYYAKGKVYT